MIICIVYFKNKKKFDSIDNPFLFKISLGFPFYYHFFFVITEFLNKIVNTINVKIVKEKQNSTNNVKVQMITFHLCTCVKIKPKTKYNEMGFKTKNILYL